ncbi:MAG: hypothetical protein GY811_03465 [Myxococcales bacterium]|nr:hypothetical protein [Myxococcales bacterium]
MPHSPIAGPKLGCAVSLLLTCAIGACSDEPPAPTDGQVEGARLAVALSDHVLVTSELVAPHRCARFQADLAPPTIDGVGWDATTGTLVMASQSKRAKLATISDARVDKYDATGSLERLRSSLNAEKIDVLISLGGLATTEATLESILGALTENSNYLVWALPGDRESLVAHRRAVSKLARSGARILDASHYRKATLGQLQLITMPGISKVANLVTGVAGCTHTEADVTALVAQLEPNENPTLLLSYAPWRQQGGSASDLGVGAVHSGELLLEPLKSSGRVGALVHGMLTPSHLEESGSVRLDQPPASIASGSIASTDIAASALMLSVQGAKLSWKRLPVQ